jgi:hypothetical protein
MDRNESALLGLRANISETFPPKGAQRDDRAATHIIDTIAGHSKTPTPGTVGAGVNDRDRKWLEERQILRPQVERFVGATKVEIWVFSQTSLGIFAGMPLWT